MTPPQFETILTTLLNGGVRFVLVGAVAGLAHGLTRLVRRRRVRLAPPRQYRANIERLCASVRPLHLTLRLKPDPTSFQLNSATVQTLSAFALDTDLGVLDLLADVESLGDYQTLLGS